MMLLLFVVGSLFLLLLLLVEVDVCLLAWFVMCLPLPLSLSVSLFLYLTGWLITYLLILVIVRTVSYQYIPGKKGVYLCHSAVDDFGLYVVVVVSVVLSKLECIYKGTLEGKYDGPYCSYLQKVLYRQCWSHMCICLLMIWDEVPSKYLFRVICPHRERENGRKHECSCATFSDDTAKVMYIYL